MNYKTDVHTQEAYWIQKIHGDDFLITSASDKTIKFWDMRKLFTNERNIILIKTLTLE